MHLHDELIIPPDTCTYLVELYLCLTEIKISTAGKKKTLNRLHLYSITTRKLINIEQSLHTYMFTHIPLLGKHND